VKAAERPAPKFSTASTTSGPAALRRVGWIARTSAPGLDGLAGGGVEELLQARQHRQGLPGRGELRDEPGGLLRCRPRADLDGQGLLDGRAAVARADLDGQGLLDGRAAVAAGPEAVPPAEHHQPAAVIDELADPLHLVAAQEGPVELADPLHLVATEEGPVQVAQDQHVEQAELLLRPRQGGQLLAVDAALGEEAVARHPHQRHQLDVRVGRQDAAEVLVLRAEGALDVQHADARRRRGVCGCPGWLVSRGRRASRAARRSASCRWRRG